MKPTEAKDVFEPPEDLEQPIWRFMDFTKCLVMLERSELFFARSSTFDDPFEGSFPRMNKIIREADLAGLGLSEDRVAQLLSNRAVFNSWNRHWMLVSCWHMNSNESAGMWKLYSQSREAVGIRSTYARLRTCMPPEIFIGKVKYINYDESNYVEEGNTFFPYVHKRLAFQHEQELRAVIWKPPVLKSGPLDLSNLPPDKGEGVHVEELTKLIESIFVGPGAPDWFLDLVKRVVQNRYSLPLDVKRSSLDEPPFL